MTLFYCEAQIKFSRIPEDYSLSGVCLQAGKEEFCHKFELVSY
jgi:hypothetical protein